MQNSHCRHAKASIQPDAIRHYLGDVNENSLKTLRKRLKMNLIRNFRNWRRYRETVNELSRLSTRELNDLGITRADIHGIARGAR
jgi:uncharacterized protein YjiS (DUF1127 family)